MNPFQANSFLHGTSHGNAASIVREGFRVWFTTDEDGRQCSSGGVLGNGIYVTKNAGTALYFGPVVFRLSLRPGTRLLDTQVPPDARCLASLKREFGHEILSKPPRLVLPRNKRLTLAETIALFRYHISEGNFYRRVGKLLSFWGNIERSSLALFNEMTRLLKNHQFHGFGDPEDWEGIVIFAPDRLVPEEIVMDIPAAEYTGDRFLDIFFGNAGGIPLLTTLPQIHRHYPLRTPSEPRAWLDCWQRPGSGKTPHPHRPG